MIGITGATGQLGTLVIEDLLKTQSPAKIVAFVRDEAKAAHLKKRGVIVRVADYNQPDTWKKAMTGVTKLLLISSNEIGQREAQHKNVIGAAREAGVGHIFYTSLLKADSSKLALADEHRATEKALRESGITYTFLRNGWYLENHTENLAHVLQTKILHGAAKEGRFSSASRKDFAEAAAKVLLQPGHENKVYELAGETSFSLEELVAELSRQTNQKIVYMNHSFEDFKSALIAAGLPEGFAYILADSDVKASQGDLESSSQDLKKIIGHSTTLLSEQLSKTLQKVL